MSTQQHTSRSPWALSPVLLLVCALLWAQALGLAHRIVHGPLWNSGHALAQPAVDRAAGQGAADKLLASLFGNHQGDNDCRLYDQLGHADAVPAVPLLALPALLPLLPLAGALGQLWHSRILPFQARAPPLTR